MGGCVQNLAQSKAGVRARRNAGKSSAPVGLNLTADYCVLRHNLMDTEQCQTFLIIIKGVIFSPGIDF